MTLGIGGNTTIFTLVKAVFLEPIPIKDPSTAVVVYATRQTADGKVLQFLQSSYLNSKDYRERNDVFSGLSLFLDSADQLYISNSGKPRFVDVQLVDWDFFDILGVHPMIGRTFAADEDQTPGARPVVILSFALWNTQFGADPNILGKNIRINEQDYSAIGVMPKELQGIGAIGSPDLLGSDHDAPPTAARCARKLIFTPKELVQFHDRQTETGSLARPCNNLDASSGRTPG